MKGAHRGLFITLEGGDGAGKTTHLSRIQNWLVGRGEQVVVTREPGGTPTGERIREILLHGEDRIADEVELMLMFAARAQSIHDLILPALDAGKCVLSDRFTDASYAYQGGGRGIPWNRIAILEDWVQRELQPDLTLVLDVPVETGIKRSVSRGEASDRFERSSIDFKSAVRQAYLTRCEQFPDRVKRVDASKELEAVAREIESLLSHKYHHWRI